MNNKKLSFFLIGVTSLVLSISSVVYASEALINVNNLNVRNGPGTDFEPIGQINNGESYPILEEQGGWVKLQIGDNTGWVSNEFVTISKEDNQEVVGSGMEGIENYQMILIEGEIHVRNQPSTDGDIIGTTTDQIVELQMVRQVNDWIEIEWENTTGFIPSWLVKETTMQSKQPGIKDKIIVLDAGHGGRDVGAIGYSGSYEKNSTLRTAYILKRYLEMFGAKVILTRKDDNYLSLNGRASVSNLHEADVFLSIHYNSTPQLPNVSGISTYYYTEHDQTLARTLQNELVKSTNMNNRGTQYESFQVTRTNHRPAILLELGFLSNDEEEKLIQSSAFQEKVAKGIISGLDKYFEN